MNNDRLVITSAVKLLLRGILFGFTADLFVAFVTPDDFQEPIKPICTTLLVFTVWQGAALYSKWQELKKVMFG